MIGRQRARAAWWMLVLVLILLSAEVMAQAAPANARRFTTADGLPSNLVHAMLEDTHGYLWFASDDGLARFDGRRFRLWRVEQGLPDNQVLALARDADDQLWLGTRQGRLVRVSADRQQLETFDVPRPHGLASAPIVVVLPGPGGEVWFGTRGAGLFRRGADGRLRQYLPTVRGDGVPDRTVEHLAFTADGALWVGTPHGLARWRDGRFSTPEPSSLAGTAVTSLLAGSAGGLWVGSTAGPWFSATGAALEPVQGSIETRALGVSRHGGPWLATGTRVWQQHGAASPDIALASLGGRLEPQLRAVFEDRHGGLWLLGRHLGVWRLPPHWRHFQAVDAPAARTALSGVRLEDAQVHQLHCGNGRVWTIDAHALALRGAPGIEARRWAWDVIAMPRPQGPQAVHCAKGDSLWWGGRAGLQHWSQGRFQPVAGAGGEVDALHAVNDGVLWVASPGVLRRYRVSDTGVQHSVRIDERHGLPALRLSGLATDARGVLWASSARGLVRVQPRQGRVRVYTGVDGVPAPVLSAGLQAQGPHMLAIAADGSAVRFDPEGLAMCHARPALVVERVQVHRHGRLQVLPVRPEVRLHPGDRDIQVTVRQLGPALEAPHYRFRLLGQDADWIRVGRRGTRGFPQLPPGEHRLEFQARQGDGHWSGSQRVLLVVERSGWQHPLVAALRVLLVGVLLGGAAWVAWRRLARLRTRDRSAQRQAAAAHAALAKERYLATLGHEVRTPLTGVLGLSELLLASPLTLAQRQQLERVRQGGQTLLHVLNLALDEARIEAGQMPLQQQVLDVASLCRQWQARNVLALCPRGTGLAVCLHLPPGALITGDPQRLMQLLDDVAHTLVVRTASAGVVLQVGWRPGREGLLLELVTTGPRSGRHPAGRPRPAVALVPTPSRQALMSALAGSQALLHTLGGTLQLHAGAGGRWHVLLSLPLPESTGDTAPSILRVLLVDADSASSATHRALLESQGHAVVHVTHALAALAELQSQAQDVVIVAQELPGVDGLALLQMLRARGEPVPVVMIGAREDDPVPLHAAILAAGGQGLLCTPTSAAALEESLRLAVAG